MKTDRELLELAAKAEGLNFFSFVDSPLFGTGMNSGEIDGSLWNPLINDGDAFRLAVKLGMHMSPDLCGRSYANDTFETINANMGNTYASLRRAIVRHAARIGSEMP